MIKKFKAPKEFLNQWLEDLRSGEYEQGKGSLYADRNNDDDGVYCCLGVACIQYGYSTYEMSFSGLPSSLLQRNLPEILLNTSFTDYITAMNDSILNEYNPSCRIHKFEEIANWIEENVEGI